MDKADTSRTHLVHIVHLVSQVHLVATIRWVLRRRGARVFFEHLMGVWQWGTEHWISLNSTTA